METRIINTALCSFGMSGWVFHAPFLTANPGFSFYGVWERSKSIAKEKYPELPETYRSLEELLADIYVELVVVNTPSITHYDYAKKAILAGKHVIVEKPFTATVEQAKELVELAAKQNVLLSVYHNRRYDSDFKTVKKILGEGLLGDIVDVSIQYDRFAPELSYKIHKETPTAAVGGLYDLGSHLIDQALQLFGMPDALFADIAINRPGSKVDDYFDVKLFYPSHRVSLRSSYYVREAVPGFQLHGKKGSFIKHRSDVQEALLQKEVKPGTPGWGIEPENIWGILHTEKDGQVIRETIPSERGDYGEYYDAMYNSIVNGAPLPVTGEEAMNVIKIIEAALQSHKEKRVITL